MSNRVKPENVEDPVVTWADQQQLNRFGRLLLRIQDLEDELAAKKQACVSMKDCVSDIDALFDEDSCFIKVGEVFFPVSNDAAKEYCEEEEVRRKKEYAEALELQVRHLGCDSCSFK